MSTDALEHPQKAALIRGGVRLLLRGIGIFPTATGTLDRHRRPEERADHPLPQWLLHVSRVLARFGHPRVGRCLSARVRLLPDGTAEVEVAASDMGPGTYTSMTQVAAEMRGLPMEQVCFSLGRSDFPPAPPHGGSQTMASVGSAIRAACIVAQEDAAKRAVADQRSPVFGAPLDGVEWNEGAFVAAATPRRVSPIETSRRALASQSRRAAPRSAIPRWRAAIRCTRLAPSLLSLQSIQTSAP